VNERIRLAAEFAAPAVLALLNSAVLGAQPAVTARTIEVPFASHDGFPLFGKLTLPATPGRHAVVIYVQTAEGSTVDMKRQSPKGGTFNYYDLYRAKLPELDVAFFSYEGRGIRMGDQPPRYEQIEWEVYNTSTLDNKVRDILTAVRTVREQDGVDPSQIFLMGASEGTMLAAEAASRAPKEIKGLILYAVLANTLKDALKYMAGDGNFLALRNFFDTDKDGKITCEEFDADLKKIRERAMKGVTFEVFDANKDGVFTVEDMRLLRKPILEGIESENLEIVDAFLKPTAVVSVPKGWVKDHFSHAPMWTFLAPLDTPVGIFHGSGDNLTPIADVKQLEDRAAKAGKKNFRFQYFDGLDHSLGIVSYFVRGTLPEGHKAIFEFIRSATQPREAPHTGHR
jgi:acetyl esterase/lipase